MLNLPGKLTHLGIFRSFFKFRDSGYFSDKSWFFQVVFGKILLVATLLFGWICPMAIFQDFLMPIERNLELGSRGNRNRGCVSEHK